MSHGHVLKSDAVARCGGPGICAQCAIEATSVKPDGNVHTMPTDQTHYETSECWCVPELMDDFTTAGGRKHYLHRQFQ